ncbi:MAG TPA: MFS transporter [Chloroflexota bacterium]|jgi:MFS family permease|nr:MFS transporter [Chloroflexota bacterium]
MLFRIPRVYYGWILVATIMLLSFSSAGSRFSFGVFVKPMTETLGWERASISLVQSVGLLLAGLMRPASGYFSDRLGPKPVYCLGLLLCGLALFASSFTTEYWQFFLSYGILLAIGYGCASPVTTTSMVSAWFYKKRALALSLGSTGTSMGELVVVPLAMSIVLAFGWQMGFRTISLWVLLLVFPLALLLLASRPSDKGLKPYGFDTPEGHRQANAVSIRFGEALKQADLWRLTLGFFVCGFTMSFANTHFIPFASDMGMDDMAAAQALGLVGAFSIVGGLSAGAVADRFGRKNVLALVYFIRGFSFLVLFQAHDLPSLYLGSLLLGISWTSTGPLTSALTADRCGLASLGTIYGAMFTIMPIGSALGAYVDGLIYDRYGTYEPSLLISALAGFVASVVVFGVGGKPRTEPAPLAVPSPAAG